MKKLLLAVVLVAVYSSVALALDPMGPPTAGLSKGKWGVGVEYLYGEMDLERQPTSWSNAERVARINTHKIYANIGYGVAENVDLFARVGGARLEWDRIPARNYSWEGDDGDWDFIWGGGVKMTLCNSSDVSWGLLGQFTTGALSGGQHDTESSYSGGYEVTITEIQIAAGPTWQASERMKIYGGPFVDLISGRWQDSLWGYKQRKPIQQEYWLCGYVGTEINVAENSDLTAEFLFNPDGWAFAGGIVFKR